MGRGRAKAKQAKVARQLKYSSPATDFEALQRELSGAGDTESDQVEDRSEDLSDEYDYEDEYDYRR